MKDDPHEVRETIEQLTSRLNRMQYEYYVLGQPSHADSDYDRLFDRLLELEKEFPEFIQPDSPTQRIGSDLSSELPEVSHTIPVLSLDKAYSSVEVLSWMTRVSRRHEDLNFIAEEKIDGVSIVLYYEKGLLQRALTRGNGFIGNDVTANVKTIRAVPLRLPEAVTIAVRGEIYLPKDEFERLNRSLETPFANPRNLAAGTIRRIRSRETAAVPLEIFVYEGYTEDRRVDAHTQMIDYLKRLEFRVNPRWAVCDTPEELEQFIKQEESVRSDLPYEIDGLVIKVDQLNARRMLGFTGHHPRWALAYKFEAPQAETEVISIDVQIGRTGRATPVARVKPVRIGGSTVSNVTLHNQDYIQMLEVALGDQVAVSKRGDVIPAVEKVVEKNEAGNTTWRMPEECPSCGQKLETRGAHQFCPNHDCPDQVFSRIKYFVGRDQMDIDGMGDKTLSRLIQMGLVGSIPDLYTADYTRLMDVPGFGEKKVAQLRSSIEKSRQQPFSVVLSALGIPELGEKAAELLISAGFDTMDKILRVAESGDAQKLVDIEGFGEKTAQMIITQFTDPRWLELIEQLKHLGLNMAADAGSEEQLPQVFSGQSWCVTGSFSRFKPRFEAEELIKKHGGRVVSSVTGKTTHLLVGESAGSKLKKAVNLGVKIVGEEEFIELIS
jgi:DNA ligase (NAD+)